MRCLILDDEPPAREGLRKLLAAHEGIQVIGEAGSVEAALRLAGLRQPDVVFVDVQLRGETGFDFIARLAVAPHLIFVTAHDRYAASAFRVDAVDYLLKPVDPEALAEALSRVKRRTRFSIPPAISHPAALQSLGLTAREAEVLFWMAKGKSNPEIAVILSNSPETVKKQAKSVLERLGVENRMTAVLVALRVLGESGD